MTDTQAEPRTDEAAEAQAPPVPAEAAPETETPSEADMAADGAPEAEPAPDPEPDPSPLDGLRATVIAACERLGQASRSAEIDFIRGQLGDLRALVASVRPGELTPRRGLGGLFDSRRKRLARFRAHVIDLAPAVGTALVKLRDAAAEIGRRNGALNPEHETLRGALAELDAAAPDGGDAAREAGTRHLALTRMIQNVDARLAETAAGVGAAAQAWRDDMLKALGADGRKLQPLKRVQVDQGALSAACENLIAAIDRAEAALNPARARRDEVMARMARALDTARGGPEGEREG